MPKLYRPITEAKQRPGWIVLWLPSMSPGREVGFPAQPRVCEVNAGTSGSQYKAHQMEGNTPHPVII